MNWRENSYFDWLTTHYEDSPFWKHMNIKVLRIDEGEVKLEMKINPELLNVLGTSWWSILFSIRCDNGINNTISSGIICDYD